jgi:UDP-N-acetylglucosamine 2-epimerase (non-hydrolysing)
MGPLVVCAVGTRPEAIKMAPVIARLRQSGSGFNVRVLSTGQHRGLLDRALADFGITVDEDLDLMRPDQALADLAARALSSIAAYLAQTKPELVLAQGDTTTVCATALACYYNRVPFGHVEAGLRTGRPYDPFPEEGNRLLADRLAALHFAPLARNRGNLVREGIDARSIHVTGNTVIDALLAVLRGNPPLPVRPATERFLLVTAHRRESFGEPLANVCRALASVVARQPDLSVVFPVHPNPNVRQAVGEHLQGRERIHLIEPVGYAEFVALMNAACVILTDSGGVQEEAPSLGKPVLVLRTTTERPEAIAAGAARLVGTDRDDVVAAVESILADAREPRRAADPRNPFGDGWAAERIARVLADRFGIAPGPWPAGVAADWTG